LVEKNAFCGAHQKCSDVIGRKVDRTADGEVGRDFRREFEARMVGRERQGGRVRSHNPLGSAVSSDLPNASNLRRCLLDGVS
jgi:hypothetical protein